MLPGLAGAPPPHLAASGSWIYSPHWRNLTPITTGAPPLLSGSMTYDSRDRYVVWYGGTGPIGVLHETWTFSGGGWTNITRTAGVPPPGSVGEAMCDDRTDGYVLLFGGGTSAASAQTWKFGNGTWTNLTSTVTGTPPARLDAGMTYDAGDQTVLLFGGWASSGYRNDSFTYHAGVWRAVVGSPVPPARAHPGLAYDALDNQTVLVGGGNGSGALNDTWTYSAGKWSSVTTASAPFGLGLGSVSAAPGGGIAGFGGVGCNLGYFGICNDTFEFYAGTWHALGPDGGPGIRTALSMTYDARDGLIAAFGGVQGGHALNDTWALGGPVAASLAVRPPVVEEGGTAGVDTLVSGGYGALSYSYVGLPPDCVAGVGPSFNCTSEAPGTYAPTATVGDSGGNTSRPSTSFVVLARLASLLNITPSVTDVGRPVLLQVLVSGGATPTNYSWTGLPAGCPSSYTNRIACAPSAPGFYGITVQVTDILAHVTVTPATSLLVNADPSVFVSANVSTGIAPLSVLVRATIVGGTGPFSYNWTFGDGTTSSAPITSHVFTGQGNYTIALGITDARNVNATAAGLTTVRVIAPLAAILQAVPASVVAPATLQLNVTPSGGLAPYSIAWSFGDGTGGSGAAVRHTYRSPGVYTIEVGVADSSGQAKLTEEQLTVSAPAPPPPSASARVVATISNPIVAGALGAAALAAALWLTGRARARWQAPPPTEERAPKGPPAPNAEAPGRNPPPG